MDDPPDQRGCVAEEVKQEAENTEAHGHSEEDALARTKESAQGRTVVT